MVRYQIRIGIALVIGLALVTGVLVTVMVDGTASANQLENLNYVMKANSSMTRDADSGSHTRSIQKTDVPTLEVQAYLPILQTNNGPCTMRPTQVSPTHTVQVNTLIPTFVWDNGINPNADITRLDISLDPQMMVLETWLTAPIVRGQDSFRFPDNFTPDTTYYWRVYFLCDGGSQGPYSDVWSFTTGSAAGLLPPPTLISPVTGTLLTTNEVTMVWQPAPGAIEYIIAYRPVGVVWYNYQQITETHYTTDNLYAGMTYEWWVKVANAFGYSGESEKWRFTTPATAETVLLQEVGDKTVYREGETVYKAGD